jgi:hypothetical protein
VPHVGGVNGLETLVVTVLVVVVLGSDVGGIPIVTSLGGFLGGGIHTTFVVTGVLGHVVTVSVATPFLCVRGVLFGPVVTGALRLLGVGTCDKVGLVEVWTVGSDLLAHRWVGILDHTLRTTHVRAYYPRRVMTWTFLCRHVPNTCIARCIRMACVCGRNLSHPHTGEGRKYLHLTCIILSTELRQSV